MKRISAALLISLLATPASAHDYWLVPNTFTPKAGGIVSVQLQVGEAFKPEQEVAYQPKKTAILQLHTAEGVITDFLGLKEDSKPAFSLTAPKAGTAVLRLDRSWSTITMKAGKFTEYLKEEGFDDIIPARTAAGETDKEGRERYRRFLKTILQVGPNTDDTATKQLGQVLEIIPAKNPYSLKAGDELPVKIVFENKPLAGAKVTAWHRDGEKLTTVSATTDKDGSASLKLPKSGAWVVRSVHMRRVAEKNPEPAADCESFWSAITFDLP